jgi:hypothetical protein
MSNIHDAILALNSSIITIRGDVAYDKDDKVVQYDKAAAEAKLVEMQNAETTAKTAALAKLAALGLTTADLTALGL